MTRVILAAMLLMSLGSRAQEQCNLSISGKVVDEHDGQALSYAEVSIPATGRGVVVDSTGYYQLENICPGRILILVTHIGCDPVSRWINLTEDIENLDFYLEHHEELLQEIVLVDQQIRRSPKAVKSLDQQELKRVQELGLEALGEEVAGYNSLSAGNNIIKPVIHGMYGNRVITSVNGIPLEDQQWGREHGLNADPAMAGSISVISGAAAVEHGPGALGGVLIISPEPMPEDTILSGQANLQAQSNGRGGRMLIKLEEALEGGISWRSQIAGFRLGDLQAPNYNLSNTGTAGLNYALEAGLNRERWRGRLFYQATNTDLGILRASSTGNLTDLEEAIGREEPLYQEDFTYQIAPPRQEISHHTIGTEWRYRTQNDQLWELRYGYQLNRRKEYDFRRGISDDTPANDLKLTTQTADLKYHFTRGRKWRAKYGLSGLLQVNSNVPGTGIRPILPNYNRYRIGVFSIQEWEQARWVFTLGARYDYEYILAQKYDRQNILRKPEFTFHNFSLSLGGTFRINEKVQYSSDLALASRPPHVIELLSEGLHHGAASIEIGDSTLTPEYSLNWSHTLRMNFNEATQLELTAYANPVHNYIFQVADSIPRLTIRGAFPVWNYVQSNVFLVGTDLSFNSRFGSNWFYRLNASYVRGYDLGNNEDLILMPPPRLNHRLTHKLKNGFSLAITHEWSAEQTHYPEGLDLSPPPPAFNLLHFDASWSAAALPVEISLQIRNLTNNSYRIYLDSFRYFADRPGINFVLNLKYQF